MSFISGAQGQLVIFAVDGTGSPVRLSDTSSPVGATTVTASDIEWRIQSSAVQYRSVDRRQSQPLPLSIDAGTMTVAGERIWVLSPDATALVSIDPTTRPPTVGDVLAVLVPIDPAQGGNGGR